MERILRAHRRVRATRSVVLLMSALASAAGMVLCCGAQGPAGSLESDTKPAYRQFAMQHDGDVLRGQGLFADEQRTGCTRCHTLDSRGGRAGPDLFSVGDQFSRSELIDAVLLPSAKIAVGYSTTIVEDTSGEEYEGVLKQVTDAWIELMGGDGKRVRIAAGNIREQRGSEHSLMPDGLQTGLSFQEFADLMEFLVSLKQPAHSLLGHQGMPEEIPPLARPIEVRPFLREALKVSPSGNASALGLTWCGQVPGRPGRFVVAHQTGMAWLVEKESDAHTEVTSVFLDLTRETFSARGPNGLLGLTFHPQFRNNRKYYLKRQVLEAGKITTVLEEREFAADFRHDSGQPPRRLLTIPSVAEHHNGGCLQFGPDGFLYIGMGDSAPNFDPQGYAQNLGLLFGKMLRIDVDRQDPGLPYAIPMDNPFLGRPNARPEIWAYGLREPWRFSFDSVTGDLWVADLGQERGDEVDLIRRGGNYGWNVYEGFELFDNGHRKEGAEYIPPLFAGRRKHGIAVVGGRVFRGDPQSSFYGVYVFGDHQSKRIWGLTQSNGTLQIIRQLGVSPQLITAFTADEAGNLYVVGYEGMVYRLDFEGARFE
ncbi:MAG: PQQ-dependent sugar dehydrogenase [Verrucomicrobiales bacterium]|nr:PQQ-dependent sugar dehydrogenase [Verrucomicrobiales bacterium]